MHHSAIGGDGFKTLADGEAVEYEVEDNPDNGKARAALDRMIEISHEVIVDPEEEGGDE